MQQDIRCFTCCMWQPGFAFSLFPDFISFCFEFGVFESIQMDLYTWACPWFSPKWLINLYLTLLSLKNPKNGPRNIFHKRKIFNFFSEIQFKDVSSTATLLFLASKNLRKFSNIPWTQADLPEQKYCMTFWNIFAIENHFSSGPKFQFVQQVHFPLSFWPWSFFSLNTLLRNPKPQEISPNGLLEGGQTWRPSFWTETCQLSRVKSGRPGHEPSPLLD